MVELPLTVAQEVVQEVMRAGAKHINGTPEHNFWNESTYLGKLSANLGRVAPSSGLLIHPDVWTFAFKRYVYEKFKM